ncbi:heme-copper oxidase subunit III [soil metagenome]
MAAVDTAPTERGRGPSTLGVGTVTFLASELMFFSGLFAAWFSVRAANDEWPPADVELEVIRTGVATAVLIASSFTMHAGHRAAEAGDRRRTARWVLVTAVLATLFLANQALEYAGADFGISSHAYGSLFFILTGFHGLHVLAGIGLMLSVLWVVTGPSRAPLADPLTVTSYYWHFVDVVWVAMFATIYLL